LSLFSNGKRVRAARHRNVAAALRTEETRQNAQAQLQAQASEVTQLSAALTAYDEPLLHETLRLLMRAVQLGEIPITTYYTEADAIYRKLQERLDIQTRYRKALARLGQQDLW
ncbi:MAG: TolC family protein, partial [Bacteroidaceae bacterium]|nr:TolC family protein [Bacteroidaceae bacterium]